MPPARAKAIDDARSETSSTIFNLKERNALSASTGTGVSKLKRTVPTSGNGTAKVSANGIPISTAVTSADNDPSLPRTDWMTISPQTLHSYRIAYRLPTQPSYTHPHAQLIYNSSKTGQRAPSAVQARRRLQELKDQRKRIAQLNGPKTGLKSAKTKQKSKETDRDTSSERQKTSHNTQPPPQKELSTQTQPSTDDAPTAPLSPPSSNQAPDNTTVTTTASPQPLLPPTVNISEEYIGKQPPTSLATAVRKHFNAQQLNEAETVARFIYVAHQDRTRENVNLEGSDGDGNGHWMGLQGREVRKGEGGEVGFRLRFRP